MAYDSKLREEEIKNKVAADAFGAFDCTRIFGALADAERALAAKLAAKVFEHGFLR